MKITHRTDKDGNEVVTISGLPKDDFELWMNALELAALYMDDSADRVKDAPLQIGNGLSYAQAVEKARRDHESLVNPLRGKAARIRTLHDLVAGGSR